VVDARTGRLLIGVASALVWSLMVVSVIRRTDRRLIVRNSSGRHITTLEVTVVQLGGPWPSQPDDYLRDLAPGESLVLRHRFEDGWYRLKFQSGDRKIEHQSNFASVGTGNGWVVEIRPDGKLDGGHESSTTERPR
jgi:hypothetical protein